MNRSIVLALVPSLFAGSALAAPITSCSVSDQPTLSDLSDSVDAAAAAFPAPGAVLNFRVEDGSWITKVETASGGPGVLFAGAPLELVSAASRFPRCGNSNVTAYVRTDDGQVTAVPMTAGDMMLNRIGWANVPASARSIDVWFKSESQTSDRYGSNVTTCTEWDSNFGNNYHFDLKPFNPSVAHFGANASSAPSLEKPLAHGGALAIDYDPARLATCRTSRMGYPTWGIRAHARFDDGSETSTDVVAPGDRGDARRPSIGIPDGARHAEVWFENYGLYPGTPGNDCQAWDSNNGANYSFDVN